MHKLYLTTVIFAALWLWPVQAGSRPGSRASGPLSPREEQATFRLLKGFKIELAACEPAVVDPVALAFDEHGRMFVVEMRGYPNEGIGTGFITSGRVQMLEDRDGDGHFEKATTFADKLRLPTSVMPYRGGLIVANPPDLVFMEDIDGDGKADRQRVLYTDFGLSNIQQMINSLQWGLDNWVHGCAGSNGGDVRSPEIKNAAIPLRTRHVRFRPDVPGSLEPTSGGGQFGLTADDWGNWFTATNSQHLRHVVLPDQYLRRNPFLPVSAVTLDIPDHGAACKVHRLSPFEAWRVERTTRRKDGPDAQRFAATELVPGGFITSACSPLVYRADQFPSEFYGNLFVCDPANNLIHRDLLVPRGATFTAQRGDADCEFLASTDNFFRPVNMAIGPDGAVYLCDFYREAIETPLSLPDDIKKKMNLESQGRGRIWRVTHLDKTAKRTTLGQATGAQLVRHLEDANAWTRLTAQRLLIERQDKTVFLGLQQMARESKFAPARAHALWTLHGLGSLADAEIQHALRDAEAGVREQALRLAESRLARTLDLQQSILAMIDDPSPRVRFQLAFTLGEWESPATAGALARILVQDAGDPWTQTAVLSSSRRHAPAILEILLDDVNVDGATRNQLLTRLAGLAVRADAANLPRLFSILARAERTIADRELAVLEGLGQALPGSLERLWRNPPANVRDAVEKTRALFGEAAARARNDQQELEGRLAATRLLGYGPFALARETLPDLLTPQTPRDLQRAAVRALATHNQPQIADLLLAPWASYSPEVRRDVLDALFGRKERVRQLLKAIDQKKVLAGQLEPARLDQLRKYPDAAVRKEAARLLAGQVAPARQKVVADYQDVREMKGDAARGKDAFKKVCAACHRLENVGSEVGADLVAALGNKTAEALLIDILDPSREVDPRFIEYVVTTTDGRVHNGVIAAETASSVTLRRAEKGEDVILRNQIESIQATAKSLMPEGLEMQLGRPELADVIAYLMSVGRKK